MLITLKAGRPFKSKASASGQVTEGFMYGGTLEDGKYILFFSKVDRLEAIKTSPLADLNLENRIDLFSGKEKWRELPVA